MSADAVSFRRALPSVAEAARELILRSMGHWDHPADYLGEAAKLSNQSAQDLRRDDAWMVLVDDARRGLLSGRPNIYGRDSYPHVRLVRERVRPDYGTAPQSGGHKSVNQFLYAINPQGLYRALGSLRAGHANSSLG